MGALAGAAVQPLVEGAETNIGNLYDWAVAEKGGTGSYKLDKAIKEYREKAKVQTGAYKAQAILESQIENDRSYLLKPEQEDYDYAKSELIEKLGPLPKELSGARKKELEDIARRKKKERFGESQDYFTDLENKRVLSAGMTQLELARKQAELDLDARDRARYIDYGYGSLPKTQGPLPAVMNIPSVGALSAAGDPYVRAATGATLKDRVVHNESIKKGKRKVKR